MRRDVTLITDSSACLPAAAVVAHDIVVVPISVQIADQEYRDGIDLDPQALYRALRDGTPVKSAAPSPLDYLDAIQAAGDRPVVVVTPAQEFTRMHHHAVLGAELAQRSVAVVDSRAAAAAHGLVVLAAAEALAAGGGLDDAVAAAEEGAGAAELVAAIESLDQLRASGRVPAVTLGLASRLGVRPVFRMRGGSAERVALPRSEEAALRRVVREWRSGGGPAAGRAAVFHAGRPDQASRLAEQLGVETIVSEFSAAMAIHTGPGAVGVAWLRPQPAA
jgi:DegV family protein with EDD domain